MRERDVTLADGRVIHTFDSGVGERVLLWHHGSPQTGAVLEPVLRAAEERGIRAIGYGRPSYGGSSAHVGRDVASAAHDVAQVMDALGVETFAVMGASGGGPHALACAALLRERATAAVTLAGIAPFTTEFDWFAGMAAPDDIRAAFEGRAARVHRAEVGEFDPASFIAADFAALDGEWKSLGEDVGRSAQWGDDGLIDDDVAFASPWGFDVGSIEQPVLIVQGGLDRVVPATHGEWLARSIHSSELWMRPDDGHVSVLSSVHAALDWIVAGKQSKQV
jgi:pimeloyl-ACP methyl ester carboxylesterase